MIHIDGCRTPPRIQASRVSIARPVKRPVSWFGKLKMILKQKGDPTL